MAIRRALSIPEILEHIFTELQHVDPRPNATDRMVREAQNRASLARSARVCKDFRDPALRILWAHIPTFAALVRLLPAAIELQVGDIDDRSYVLKGEVKAADWARFEHYARLVRRCRVMADYRVFAAPDVDSSVYAYLYLRNLRQPLLPNLRELEWFQEMLTDMCLPYLLTPSLRRLTILIQDHTYVFRGHPTARYPYIMLTLVNSLSYACPALEHLALKGNCARALSALPSAFAKSRKLRSLDLVDCYVGPKVMWQLARMPALTTLRVKSIVELPCAATKEHAHKERAAFKRLRKVVVDGKSMEVAAFVSAVTGSESVVVKP